MKIKAAIVASVVSLSAISLATPTFASSSTNQPVVTEQKSKKTTALTPEGNMSVVDNTSGGKKEFYTLNTRDGSYYYLVIDKDDKGNQTVHFLNQVDDTDLQPVANDTKTSIFGNNADEEEATKAAKEDKAASKEVEATEPISKDVKDNTGANALAVTSTVIIILIVFAAIGFWLFKKFKKKKPVEPTATADFLEEDEEFLLNPNEEDYSDFDELDDLEDEAFLDESLSDFSKEESKDKLLDKPIDYLANEDKEVDEFGFKEESLDDELISDKGKASDEAESKARGFFREESSELAPQPIKEPIAEPKPVSVSLGTDTSADKSLEVINEQNKMINTLIQNQNAMMTQMFSSINNLVTSLNPINSAAKEDKAAIAPPSEKAINKELAPKYSEDYEVEEELAEVEKESKKTWKNRLESENLSLQAKQRAERINRVADSKKAEESDSEAEEEDTKSVAYDEEDDYDDY